MKKRGNRSHPKKNLNNILAMLLILSIMLSTIGIYTAFQNKDMIKTLDQRPNTAQVGVYVKPTGIAEVGVLVKENTADET